jgi:hypothetical protein
MIILTTTTTTLPRHILGKLLLMVKYIIGQFCSMHFKTKVSQIIYYLILQQMLTPEADFIYSYIHINKQSTMMSTMVTPVFSVLNFFGFISPLTKYFHNSITCILVYLEGL